MRKLEINDKLYILPGKWNELSKNDLLEFCRINLLDTSEKYRRFALLKHFTDIPYKKLRILPADSLPMVLGIFDFLFSESQLTINKIGDIEGMKSPEDALTNFTFEQFLGQSEPYSYSISVGKWNDIDNLLNVMYNYNGSDENFAKLKSISDVEKLGVYYFYLGSSNFIKKRFPLVFSKSAKTKTAPDGLEFIRLVNSLNLGDVSKNQNIKENNMYESLEFLTLLIQKNNK